LLTLAQLVRLSPTLAAFEHAIKQGVYNSWKYWKSPGILSLLLEKFITNSVIFVHSSVFVNSMDVTVMSVDWSSSSHANIKTFQSSYLYICSDIVLLAILL